MYAETGNVWDKYVNRIIRDVESRFITTGKIIKIEKNNVVVNIGQNKGVKKGDDYNVLRKGKVIKSGEIVEVDRDISILKLKNIENIHLGMIAQSKEINNYSIAIETFGLNNKSRKKLKRKSLLTDFMNSIKQAINKAKGLNLIEWEKYNKIKSKNKKLDIATISGRKKWNRVLSDNDVELVLTGKINIDNKKISGFAAFTEKSIKIPLESIFFIKKDLEIYYINITNTTNKNFIDFTSPVIKGKVGKFRYYNPDAKSVSVVGEFNKWDSKKHGMKKNEHNIWELSIELQPGKYDYKFSVDGNYLIDPKNDAKMINKFGGYNSIVNIK